MVVELALAAGGPPVGWTWRSRVGPIGSLHLRGRINSATGSRAVVHALRQSKRVRPDRVGLRRSVSGPRGAAARCMVPFLEVGAVRQPV